MADNDQLAQDTLTRAVSTAKAVYDETYKATQNARVAEEKFAHSLLLSVGGPNILASLIGWGISNLARVPAAIIQQITQIKRAGSPGISDLVAATLSDALQMEINSNEVPIGQETDQAKVAAALGGKFVDGLKKFFGVDKGQPTFDTAEAGAAAVLGLAMQMSVNTGYLAILGGSIPQLHWEELKEFGEMLEKSLGIGRLTRQALRPLVVEAVGKPLERKYRAQFQQDILGAPQIATAKLAGRMSDGRASELLHQHGLSDEMSAELLKQHTPRLHPEETELLQALDKSPQGDDFHQIVSDGTPAEVAAARLAVLAYRRKGSVRGHILSTVLSQISDGFLSPGDLDPVLSRLGVPADEVELWRILAGYSGERTRKRLSHGDMLFLYEAAQVTLEDVREWAKAEGYSDDDTDRLLLVFTLRAAGAHAGKAGGAAAKAAHAHNEHVAYVTDNIKGIFGRPPSKAELDFWVNALDQGDRTKQDFRTELKALDPSGPAIPQQ